MCSLTNFSLVAIVTAAARVPTVCNSHLYMVFALKMFIWELYCFLNDYEMWHCMPALPPQFIFTPLKWWNTSLCGKKRKKYLIGAISSVRNTMYSVCFDMPSTLNLICLLADNKMLLVIFMPYFEQIKDIPAKQIHQRSEIQYFSLVFFLHEGTKQYCSIFIYL